MGRTIEKPSAQAEELKKWCEETAKYFCDVEDDSSEADIGGLDNGCIARRTVFIAGFSKTHVLRNLLHIPERSKNKNIKLGLGITGENETALLAEWNDEVCEKSARAHVLLDPEDETTRTYYDELVLLRSLIPEAKVSD